MTTGLSSIRVAAMLVATLVATPAFATTGRTFVANNGTDTGACTAQAPCLTFAYALTQTAYAGEVVVLTPGEYGPVTITQSVSIVNDGVGTASITATSASSDAVDIYAGATDVVQLRGIEINGQGVGNYGIAVSNVGELDIVNCIIENFSNGGIQSSGTQLEINIYSSVITHNVGGIVFTAGYLMLIDDQIISNVTPRVSGDGLDIYGGVAVVKRCLIGNNITGIYLTASGQSIISDSVITSNSDAGVYANGNGQAIVDRTLISGNSFGLQNSTASYDTSTITSYENNDVVGNTTNTTGTITQQAPY